MKTSHATLFGSGLLLACLFPLQVGAVTCGGGPGIGGMFGTDPIAVEAGETIQEAIQEHRGQRSKSVSNNEARAKLHPKDPLVQKELGIDYHHLSMKHRVKGVAKKAYRQLKKAQEMAPDDPELEAWVGSARTLVARDSLNPIKKLRWAKKGARMIDRAIARAPKNIVIRNIRANNSFRLPKFLKRRHLAKKDLLKMESLFKDKKAGWWKTEPYKEEDKKNVMAEAFFKLAKIFEDEHDALKAVGYLKKAIEVSKKSPWSRFAKKKLAKAPSAK